MTHYTFPQTTARRARASAHWKVKVRCPKCGKTFAKFGLLAHEPTCKGGAESVTLTTPRPGQSRKSLKFGVDDGTRTHDNRNHNPGVVVIDSVPRQSVTDCRVVTSSYDDVTQGNDS